MSRSTVDTAETVQTLRAQLGDLGEFGGYGDLHFEGRAVDIVCAASDAGLLSRHPVTLVPVSDGDGVVECGVLLVGRSDGGKDASELVDVKRWVTDRGATGEAAAVDLLVTLDGHLPPQRHSRDDVSAALNRACDDIIAAADLPATGTVDALNLLVNATCEYLAGAASSLADVAADYGAEDSGRTLETVLGWITDRC